MSIKDTRARSIPGLGLSATRAVMHRPPAGCKIHPADPETLRQDGPAGRHVRLHFWPDLVGSSSSSLHV